jgi:hypothetical protein
MKHGKWKKKEGLGTPPRAIAMQVQVFYEVTADFRCKKGVFYGTLPPVSLQNL